MQILGFGVATGDTGCLGDCDGDGEVAVNELVLGVNIALGMEEVSACSGFDGDGSGEVTVDELVTAVNNALSGCVPQNIHASTAALAGPFGSAPEVTGQCLSCHAEEGEQFLKSAHWNWRGPTPGLVGHEDDTTVGKENLINNFCIAIRSNEARCTQCHAGYGYKDTSFNFADPGNIDCLVCHASPTSGYAKAPKTAGLPEETVDLVAAARSVGPTTVQSCGRCHFNAGGGDNVKKGDMGSALASATPEVDVHLGQGFTCASCHAGDDHTLLGQGVHVPVSEGRISCEGCHTAQPHSSSTLNNHALDIACQTCHVPAFSRQQPTKMNWDWSTAGNKNRDGETTTLPDGTVVTAYDSMKGDFVWAKEVRPEYAWYDGRVDRMTIADTFVAAGTEEDPVVLGQPVATIADPEAKIFPFKVMRGRQPADTSRELMAVPKLFGPGGFWALIPPAESYDEATVLDIWTGALTLGARAAGQIGPEESYTGFGVDWDWLYTEMYLGINHEVAPKEQALGASGTCSACHGNQAFDFEALGYACDPLMSGASACGSRH